MDITLSSTQGVRITRVLQVYANVVHTEGRLVALKQELRVVAAGASGQHTGVSLTAGRTLLH